uniref:Uncharacterized protein n=1 Tax=Timema douglasi TaxID=61478 RepID=A0A7R8VV26_TIMDO|nr:unnamed protein product [Timema douglasi]
MRRPNQQEVQGRLVGGALTDPTKWRFRDKLATEATERAKTEYRRAEDSCNRRREVSRGWRSILWVTSGVRSGLEGVLCVKMEIEETSSVAVWFQEETSSVVVCLEETSSVAVWFQEETFSVVVWFQEETSSVVVWFQEETSSVAVWFQEETSSVGSVSATENTSRSATPNQSLKRVGRKRKKQSKTTMKLQYKFM